MIEVVKFKKTKKLDIFLPRYTDMFQIESEISDDLVYGFGDGYMALITSDGMVRVETSRLQTLTALLKDEIAEEVRLIVETFSDVLRGCGKIEEA